MAHSNTETHALCGHCDWAWNGIKKDIDKATDSHYLDSDHPSPDFEIHFEGAECSCRPEWRCRFHLLP